ncbi:AraC family transcriptional regulator ligand-binding domain-containing protein [Nocardia takedensis]|uniref:AraC family transcriptional regulator n=1 Tax=Nocardia takedensis TaxID=259390 RepID=UPI000685121A|nr:AraC family transcriptional regulator [Nocardia takedensis]
MDEAIPPVVLRGVVEVGRQFGVAAVPWFAGVDVDPVALMMGAHPTLTFAQTMTVLERALRALPPGPLGLRVGSRDVLASLGMLGVALSACGTTSEVIELAAELHIASGSLVDVDFDVTDDAIVLTLWQREPRPGLTVFLFEEALSSVMVFVRTMFGGEVAPLSLELTYSAPAHAPHYRRIFPCPITFDADACRLRLPIALLERCLPFRHGPTCAAATDACRQLVRPVGGPADIIDAIERLLADRLRAAPTAADTARQLHVTERTLRRHLHSAGESFRTVRDRVRERHVTLLLQQSELTMEAIAKEVGFSDGRQLRRAYLRWTGTSPATVRRVSASG